MTENDNVKQEISNFRIYCPLYDFQQLEAANMHQGHNFHKHKKESYKVIHELFDNVTLLTTIINSWVHLQLDAAQTEITLFRLCVNLHMIAG
jgi:hypothetical protein